MSSFGKRVQTAILFVGITLVGIYGGIYSFLLLFGLVGMLCMHEFVQLMFARLHAKNRYHTVAAIALGMGLYGSIGFVAAGLLEAPARFTLVVSLLVGLYVFILFMVELFLKAENPFYKLGALLLGQCYITFPLILLVLIAVPGGDGQLEPNRVLGLLLLTWINDTGAYLVGSRFGKTPLFPRISPKKTWEGSLGGVAATIVGAVVLSYFFSTFPLSQWLVLALLVSVFGSLGDLVESMLKRSQEVKDSGRLLPGHGGVLDRFDAFLFVLPFAAAYLLLFG